MSVVGIDLGSSAAVMASVRSGRLQVLRNEISERATPAIVSYTDSGERTAGDVAMNAINSNYKCTARNMKILLGRKATPEFLACQKYYSLAPLVAGPGDHIHYDLPTTGAPISVVQAMSSFLAKLAKTAKTAMETPQLGGVVLSVPSFYTNTRVQCLQVAAQIANMNVLNCIKEYMAVAMDYGIYRRKLFDDREPYVTAFVSVGHSYTTVTIVEFTKHYAKVMATASNEDLGGRKLDDILIKEMSDKFKKETGLDASKNPRSRLKLETAAGKVKKTLSSNKEATFSLECLLEGEDLSGMINQEEFHQMAQPVAKALKALCRQTASYLTDTKIDSVELVGNGSRAPILIAAVEEAFGMPGQRTLSADETVARGCALYAAVFSPTVRVKEYPIYDWMFPVPNKLRNPPMPKPEPEAPGLMKGFFNKAAPATAETTDPAAEGAVPAEGDHTPQESPVGGDEIPSDPMTPGQSPVADPVVPEEPEDLTPLPENPEDPSITAAPVEEHTLVAYIEQEKIQAKKDEEAHLRREAINTYESAIFYCRDKARSQWTSEAPAEVIEQVNNELNAREEWLWDHMDERFTSYEDKFEELKHFVGTWFNDYKPKPKPKPEPEPVPVPEPVAEPVIEEPAEEVAGEQSPTDNASPASPENDPSPFAE